jgi:hypothetical protein
MDFKLDSGVNAVQERESRLAMLFVAFILVVGTPGIMLTWGGLRGIVGGVVYAMFMGAIFYLLHADRVRTREKIRTHRLILEGNKMILRQNRFGKEIDLRDIHGIRVHSKEGGVDLIEVNITANYGFRITGYENMETIRDVLKEKLEPGKFNDAD